MLKLFVYVGVLLASPISTFYVPSFETDHLLQKDDVVGEFIQLKSGDELRLACTHPLNEQVVFAFPNITDNKHFDPVDYASRRVITADIDRKELIIKNLKSSDTGTYYCHIEGDNSLVTALHVFVQDENAVFIPSAIHGFAARESELTVPCKTSRHIVRDEVELQVNGKVWDSATQYYDPRYGFILDSDKVEERIVNQWTFKCVYKGSPSDAAEFLIGLKKETDIADLVLEWEESFSWPYVGNGYAVHCVLRTQDHSKIPNKYQYALNVTCPRCQDAMVVTQTKKSSLPDRLIHTVNVTSMENADSGLYECNWYYEKNLMKTIDKFVTVSPKKGQFKINEISSRTITVKEGHAFSINANVSAYPEDLSGFEAKWMKMVIRPPRTINDTEPVLTDSNHFLESELPGNGLILETLTIREAVTNMSGKYVLTLKLLDTVKTIEFEVIVESKHIYPRIDIMSPDSFVLFDQKFYKPKTEISVLCLVSSVPLADVTLTYRRLYSYNDWDVPAPGSFEELIGTFEKGYKWSFTLDYDIEIKCIGNNGKESVTDSKRVRISDGVPSVKTEWEKSRKATPFENPKEIFEGDNVKLTCNVPTNEKWKVVWSFRNEELTNLEDLTPPNSHSRYMIAHINNISSTQQGEYTCIVKGDGGGQEKQLKQIIEVVKIEKPYHMASDPAEPVELEYGSSAIFNCNMDGKPKPQYLWLKDNIIYEGGQLTDNNFTLTITRVAAEDTGEFVCQAVNRAGASLYKFHAKVKGAPKSVFKPLLGLLGIAMVLVTCSCIAFFLLYFKQKKRTKEQDRALSVLYEQLMRASDGPPNMMDQKVPIDQRIYQLPYNRQYELDKENLEIGNRLGTGQFGQVWMGWLTKPRIVSDQALERKRLPVAVKGPLVGHNVTHQKMLADELKVLCAIGKHPNVLALVGAVTKNMKNGELFVVVEMCDNGNLKDYLLKYKPRFIDELKKISAAKDDDYLVADNAIKTMYAAEQNPEWASEMESDRLLNDDSSMLATSDLISFALQVANGMEYLANVPCIHRDLAARNVLITGQRTCRIADFGMARNEQYYKFKNSRHVPVPYRWMAIEAIEHGSFTQETDIWAFGVLLYEIFTLGGLPYPTISNEDLLDRLKAGHRNTRPQYCHDEIYDLMSRCWDEYSHNRPTFAQCVHSLKEHLRIASPQLLERLEKEIIKEGEKQQSFAQWLNPEDDPVEQARALAHSSSLVREQNGERIYVQEFKH